MGTLLVTVVGAGPEDVALPADMPIRDLVPRLMELCGAPRGFGHVERWTLSLPGKPPFPDTASLSGCGVLEGAVLHLRDAEAPPVPAGVGQPARPQSPPLEPGPILPFPPPTLQRMRSAARALLGHTAPSPQGSGLPAADPSWNPQSPRGAVMSPVERARASWRSGDYEQQLDSLITAPRFPRCVTLAVMSLRAGVGATTCTVLTGTMLARLRMDSVVAVDANPHDRSLVRFLAHERQFPLDDLVSLPPGVSARGRFGPRFARDEHRLGVLSGRSRLHEEAYLQGFRRAQEVSDLLLLDCPPGWHGPAARAALAVADHLILVTDVDPGTMDLVAEVAGGMELAQRPVLLVVNKVPADPERVNLRSLAARVPNAMVVVIPEESAASTAGHGFDWATAPPTWSTAVRENLVVLLAQLRAAGLTG